MLHSLFPGKEVVPTMPCVVASQRASHRDKEASLPNFAASPSSVPFCVMFDVDEIFAKAPKISALVTKLLDRAEYRSNPHAIEAIKSEGKALVDVGTWLESTVTEKDHLIRKCRSQNIDIHLGDLLTICSIKFFERPENFWRYKGRICFRGDIVKDQHGAAAVFQELTAHPTAVQSANMNMAYGCFPGNKSTTSDAVRAYVQSLLKSERPTWVHVPKELQPAEWARKYKRPMCLLERALYGHPESGAHWEKHLEAAVEAAGGESVREHPSSYWFPKDRMLLTVYVDDLLLSGPVANHDKIWNALKSGDTKITLEDAEPLDRFLGRTHRRF